MAERETDEPSMGLYGAVNEGNARTSRGRLKIPERLARVRENLRQH